VGRESGFRLRGNTLLPCLQVRRMPCRVELSIPLLFIEESAAPSFTSSELIFATKSTRNVDYWYLVCVMSISKPALWRNSTSDNHQNHFSYRGRIVAIPWIPNPKTGVRFSPPVPKVSVELGVLRVRFSPYICKGISWRRVACAQ